MGGIRPRGKKVTVRVGYPTVQEGSLQDVGIEELCVSTGLSMSALLGTLMKLEPVSYRHLVKTRGLQNGPIGAIIPAAPKGAQ